MKRLLAVYAHPDDESVSAGVLAHYARQGVEVSLISATRGEAGEISDPSLASRENLGLTRTAELQCACEIIGIRRIHFLDYCDSGMDGSPENDLPTAFIQANPEEVQGRIVGLIRQIQPDVILTFEPKGWYGHPDHIATSRHVTRAYFQAGDPQAFPERGAPWKARRLFYSAFLQDDFNKFVDYARQHGMNLGDLAELDLEATDPLASQITHILDIRPWLEVKLDAMRCHQTQFGEGNLFLSVPREIFASAMGKEVFIQADPPLSPTGTPSQDLFAGISP